MKLYRDLPFETVLRKGCDILDLRVSSRCFEQCGLYFDLLQFWNTKQNLTSVKTTLNVAVLHFLDSLTLLKVIPCSTSLVLDVGSGSGFPGLILKIVLPDLHVTLVEKNAKKMVFLKHAVRTLGMSNVRFINNRLEHFLKSTEFRPFDFVVTRALVLSHQTLYTLCLQLPLNASVVKMMGPRSLGGFDVQAWLRPRAVWSGYLPFLSAYRKLIRYSPTHSTF